MNAQGTQITVSDLAKAGHLSVLAEGVTTDGEKWYAVKVMDVWCVRIGRDFQDETEIIQKGRTLPKYMVPDFVSAEESVMELCADMVHHTYNLSH